MTIADVEQPHPVPPTRGGRGRVLGIAAGALVLALGGAGIAASGYYDSVPMPNQVRTDHAVAKLAEVPQPVLNAFVAALDPEFYAERSWPWTGSVITRRYATLAAQDGHEGSLRNGIMAAKLEDTYSAPEILGFFLNTATFERGAVGVEAAARAHFGKSTSQLSVAEAALLATQLTGDGPARDVRAEWERILDAMVERAWLSPQERSALIFPAAR